MQETETRNKKLVDIKLSPRIERRKAQAFFNGEYDSDKREVWVWLPISQIKVTKLTKCVSMVTLPEWLATATKLKVDKDV